MAEDEKKEFPKKPQTTTNRSTPVLIKNRKALPVEVKESEDQKKAKEEATKSNKSTPVLIKNRKPLPVIIAKEDKEKVTFEDMEWIARNSQKGVLEILDGIKEIVTNQLTMFKDWFEFDKETRARKTANDSLADDFPEDTKKKKKKTDDEDKEPFFLGFKDLDLSDILTILSGAYLVDSLGLTKIITSIPLLQGLAAGLLKITEDVGSLMKKITGIGNAANKVAKFVTPAINAFKRIGGIFQSFISGFGKIFVAVGAKIPFLNAVIGLIVGLRGFIRGFKEGGILRAAELALGDLIDVFISTPIEFLKDAISYMAKKLGLDGIAEALDSFEIHEVLGDVWVYIKEVTKSLFNSISELFASDTLAFLAEAATWLFPPLAVIVHRDEIFKKAVEIKDSVVSFINDTIGWIKENLSFEKIVEGLDQLMKDVFSKPEFNSDPTTREAKPGHLENDVLNGEEGHLQRLFKGDDSEPEEHSSLAPKSLEHPSLVPNKRLEPEPEEHLSLAPNKRRVDIIVKELASLDKASPNISMTPMTVINNNNTVVGPQSTSLHTTHFQGGGMKSVFVPSSQVA